MAGYKLHFPYKWCRSKLGSAFFIILCIGTVMLIINYFEGYNGPSQSFTGKDIGPKAGKKHAKWAAVKMLQVCKPPKLSLQKDTLHGAYKPLKTLKCKGNQIVVLENDIIRLDRKVLAKNKLLSVIECRVKAIRRVSADDDSFKYVNISRLSYGKENANIMYDFTRTQCVIGKKVQKVKRSIDKNSVINKNKKEDISIGRKLQEIQSRHISTKQNKQKVPKEKKSSKKKRTKRQNTSMDQYTVQVHPSRETFRRVARLIKDRPSTALSMNVLIISIDSLSQLAVERKLPKTYKYIKEDLEGIILRGYNVIGETTMNSMLALLTGKSESEIPEGSRSHNDPEHVDRYPFLWYTYERNGYATQFAEDSPHIGMFNTHLTGFRDEPTDHYMRPFWQAVAKSDAGKEKFCLNGRPKHQYTMDYVKDFFWKYRNVSRFSFMYHHELTYEDSNNAQHLDLDMERLLQLFDDKYLKNTLLVITSDHGSRSAKISLRTLGKIEERLPFLAFAFPENFRAKYPKLIDNMKKNIYRLTTPFDVHETLLDFLDFSRTRKQPTYNDRGISLLKAIPLNRTCESAGVGVHWCSCSIWKPISVKDYWIEKATNKILAAMQKAISKYPGSCEELSLNKIIDARLIVPSEKAFRFYQAMMSEDNNADFTGTSIVEYVHYLITFSTRPNSALYESTVKMHLEQQTMTVSPDITRLDITSYSPCNAISDKDTKLLKFCHCLSKHNASKQG